MEFLDIQPVSTGELYHIDQPEDLILSFESRNNAGDQIEMFLTVAETKPAEAIEIFGTIATNQLGAIQALSYQGFSKLEPKIKKAIANFQLEQSQELFQILCQEVRKNQNNESKHLACWSAAQALQEIGFSQANLQHPEGGNLAEPLTRIQKRIISQKIKEISIIRRLDIVGEFEANYETYLEFWIYGPTQKLFDAPLEDSQYISIVKDVMNCLQVRGIQLGFEATNKKVKNIAIEQLKKIFEKYKYNKNSKLKLALGDSLQRFLKSNHTNNTDLDKIAEALLFQHKNDNFNADQLDSFTISELNKLSRNQIQKKQEIVDLFHNAKEVCDPSILQEFFKYQKNKYVAEIEPKINQINAQIQKTSSEQARTKENVKILNKALETIKNIDHEFFVDKIQSLYDEYRKLSKEPKTYIECKSIQSELNTVKDKLIDWVNSIAETIKYEEVIDKLNCYVPHLFKTHVSYESYCIYDFLNLENPKYGKLILEITLKQYTNDKKEKQILLSPVKEMINRLNKVQNIKDNHVLAAQAINVYDDYQNIYAESQLFKYNIKALGEDVGDVFVILQTLLESIAKESTHKCPIITVDKHDPIFMDTLEATQKVDVSSAIEWDIWEGEFGKITAHKQIQHAIKSGSLDNGSLAFPIRPSNYTYHTEAALNSSSSGNSALAKLSFNAPPPTIANLKPLHRLTTYKEISGFLSIFIHCEKKETEDQDFINIEYELSEIDNEQSKYEVSEVNNEESDNLYQKLIAKEIDCIDLEYLINKYSQEINEDQYIVGIAKDGKPCFSRWDDLAHRIIGGTTKTGKSTFIKSVIYQFLYVNFDRKIYLADFRGGVDYKRLAQRFQNIELVTECKDLVQILQKLWEEYESRLKLLIEKDVDKYEDLLPEDKLTKHRLLLIIDEAASILNAERTDKDKIYKYLNELAAKSRAVGIHIVYCTQRPTSDILPRQISDNMEEMVVFRVDSSSLIIDSNIAKNLPVYPKGIAVYRGVDPDTQSLQL